MKIYIKKYEYNASIFYGFYIKHLIMRDFLIAGISSDYFNIEKIKKLENKILTIGDISSIIDSNENKTIFIKIKNIIENKKISYYLNNQIISPKEILKTKIFIGHNITSDIGNQILYNGAREYPLCKHIFAYLKYSHPIGWYKNEILSFFKRKIEEREENIGIL